MQLDKPFDWTSQTAIDAAGPILENIQGNILQGHARPHVRLLLVRFGEASLPDLRNRLTGQRRQQVERLFTEIVRQGEKDPEPRTFAASVHHNIVLSSRPFLKQFLQDQDTRKIIAILAKKPKDLTEDERADLHEFVEQGLLSFADVFDQSEHDLHQSAGGGLPGVGLFGTTAHSPQEPTIRAILKKKNSDWKAHEKKALQQFVTDPPNRRTAGVIFEKRIQHKELAPSTQPGPKAAKESLAAPDLNKPAVLRDLAKGALQPADKKLTPSEREDTQRLLGAVTSVLADSERDSFRPPRRSLSQDKRKELAELIADMANGKPVLPRRVKLPIRTAWDEKERPGEPSRKRRTGAFAAVLLSFSGYKALGLEAIAPQNQYFQDGIKQGNDWSPKPDTSDWEKIYREDVDAMILLADEAQGTVKNAAKDLEGKLKGMGCEVKVEDGLVLMRNTHEVEPFGFRDGISQPHFFSREPRVGPEKLWDSETPPKVVLAKDPGDGGTHGSFMVYQKLEQNLKKFHEATSEIARLSGIDQEDVCKLAVGRSKGGEPLVQNPPDDERNFTFADDENGELCPFHAHIRKVNPRKGATLPGGRTLSAADEKRMRIARRGIPYVPGEFTKERNETDRAAQKRLFVELNKKKPETGAGLLFMSFQSDIFQFLFQHSASQSPNYQRTGAGVDAITGWADPPVSQKWSMGGQAVGYLMANNVTLKGGEYFFAPSMPVLKNLPALVDKYAGQP